MSAEALAQVQKLVLQLNPKLIAEWIADCNLPQLLGFIPESHPLGLLRKALNVAEDCGYHSGVDYVYDERPLAQLALRLLAQPAPAQAEALRAENERLRSALETVDVGLDALLMRGIDDPDTKTMRRVIAAALAAAGEGA